MNFSSEISLKFHLSDGVCEKNAAKAHIKAHNS